MKKKTPSKRVLNPKFPEAPSSRLTHRFKKGEYLKHKAHDQYVEVLDCNKYSLLIRLIGSMGKHLIPYTCPPTEYKNLKVVSQKEVVLYLVKDKLTQFFNKNILILNWWQKKHKLKNSPNPQSFRQYLANYLSLAVNLQARLIACMWCGWLPTTFKGIKPGPLGPPIFKGRALNKIKKSINISKSSIKKTDL